MFSGGSTGAVKGVERHSKNPVKQDFIDFIKTKLHTFLYTLVFAWASALTSFLVSMALAGKI